MTDKDIIIVWLTTNSFPPEDYPTILNMMKEQEDERTKIIIVPDEIVETVERL